MTMLIAQLTDTHVRANGGLAFGGQVDTAARLVRAVEFLRRLEPRPTAILATGDLVDTGSAADYGDLARLLAPLETPIYAVPGNHDARDPLRAAFAEVRARARGRYVQYVVDDWPLRLVGMDTLDDGQIGGRLCAERLAWLDATLEASPRPTLLFMHHPPYHYGVQPNAAMYCAGAGELEDLVAAHGNVVAVLCGHLHRWTVTRFARTFACTGPATAPLLQIKADGGSPDGWADGPVMVALHVWRDGADGVGLVSHAVDVDESTRLRPFAAA